MWSLFWLASAYASEPSHQHSYDSWLTTAKGHPCLHIIPPRWPKITCCILFCKIFIPTNLMSEPWPPELPEFLVCQFEGAPMHDCKIRQRCPTWGAPPRSRLLDAISCGNSLLISLKESNPMTNSPDWTLFMCLTLRRPIWMPYPKESSLFKMACFAGFMETMFWHMQLPPHLTLLQARPISSLTCYMTWKDQGGWRRPRYNTLMLYSLWSRSMDQKCLNTFSFTVANVQK